MAFATAVLAVAIAVVLAAAYASRLWIAEKVIARVAAQQGIEPLTLTVSEFDLSGITIDNVSAPKEILAIDRLEITYTWRELLGNRVRKLALTGIVAKFALEDAQQKFAATSSFESGGDASSESPPLSIDHIEINNANIELAWNQETFATAFALDAKSAPDGWDTNFTGSAKGMGGTLRADWSGRINLDDPLNSTGHGTFSLNVSDRAPGTGLEASGDLTISMEGGEFEIGIPRPLVFQTGALPESLLQILPAEIAAISGEGAAINIFSDRAEAFLFRRTDTGFTGTANLRSDAQVGPSRLALSLNGEAIIQNDGTLERLFIDTATAEVHNLPLGQGHIDAKLALSDILGPDFETNSHALLTFEIRNLAVDETRVERVRGDISSQLSFQNSHLNFNLVSGQVDTKDLLVSPTISVPGLTTILLKPTDDRNIPNLSIPIGGDGSQNIQINIDTAVSQFVTTFETQNTKHTIDVSVPKLGVSGSLGFDANVRSLAINLREGEIKHELGEIDDLRLNVFLENDSISGTADLRVLEVGGVTIQTAAQQLDLRAISTFQQNSNDFMVAGGLQARNKTKFAEFKARVATDGSRGQVEFEIPNARLGSKGAIDAAMLSAFLPVTDLGGTAGLNLNAEWSGDELTHSGQITLKDVNLASSYGAFSGLSTTLTLDSLWPPQSKETQAITIKNITVGIPLTNLNAEINWPGNETSVVNHLSVSVAGGQLRTANVTVPFDGSVGGFVVTVDGIDTAIFAALADVDDLEVSGLLAGNVPVQISTGDIKLVGGKLSSIAPGFVRYRPTQPPAGFAGAGGGGLLLQALENFRYDSLGISANGSVLNEMEVILAFQGSNPDLYGGYPLAFNLKLNGEFFQLMHQGLSGYRAAETLQPAFQQK